MSEYITMELIHEKIRQKDFYLSEEQALQLPGLYGIDKVTFTWTMRGTLLYARVKCLNVGFEIQEE